MTKNTEKLFYEDPYLARFTAEVTDCAQVSDGYAVTLNRTAFYPEGGGQPSDVGTIGEARVLRAQERDGEIAHITDVRLTVGQTVTAEIDWARRFDHMQQHSGEHILSGIVQRLFGYDNVGFHIGGELVTVDFGGELTKENLAQIERESNEALYANIPVAVSYPSAEELRALSYRSKKELSGQVRIVTIAGCDTCACCGTHVSATGEVGMIKILSAQSYKGGTRTSIVCGNRALADYAAKNKAAYDISALLSAKPNEITAGVERVLGELVAQRQKVAALQTQLFAAKAAVFSPDREALFVFEDDLSPNDLRQFCALLCKQTCRAIVLSGTDEVGYKYALGSETLDVRPLGKELNAACGGRGGGAKELAQGVLSAGRQDIETFLTEHGFQKAQ